MYITASLSTNSALLSLLTPCSSVIARAAMTYLPLKSLKPVNVSFPFASANVPPPPPDLTRFIGVKTPHFVHFKANSGLFMGFKILFVRVLYLSTFF
jgi:ABC-type proline/glycine betaine transport system permease subunit